MSNNPPGELKRTLTPAMVWGLGVGYVISGNYFGWNLGLEKGGTLGLAVSLFFIIVLYITFTLSYAELACAIPKSGGAFDYARRAFGEDFGFLVGMAQNIEFIFAPPAIAFGIGAYFNLYFPDFSTTTISVVAYLLFVGLNVSGVKIAAAFELGVTVLAVGAVVLFSIVALPSFRFVHLATNALPFGWSGALAAVPFAIWFFLGIEGVANLAEESIDPKRTLLLGFGSAIATLVGLCVLTFLSAVGVAGWEAIVFKPDFSISDSPLPMAMSHLTGFKSWWYNLVILAGLFGLVASFHGLMLAAGRSTMEFGRLGYAPAFVGKVHHRFRTPFNALLVNMCLGILALLSGRTGEIITIAVFGALTLYIGSMVTLFKLRRTEPGLARPFRVPFYPIFPFIALTIACASFIAMAFYNLKLLMIYSLLMGISFLLFKIVKKSTHV